MLNPGSKAWIEKYKSLIQEGEIDVCIERPEGISINELLHLNLGNTGLLFGVPHKMLFIKDSGEAKWTSDERLKLLYFESLLMVYALKTPVNAENFHLFTAKLIEFFRLGGNSRIKNWLQYIFKPDGNEQLEEILSERIKIRKTFDNKIWVNYLHNSLIFLDVILFRLYLEDDTAHLEEMREGLALNAMRAIIYAVHYDERIDQKGQQIFDIFLASSDLNDDERKLVESQFKTGISLDEIVLGSYLKGLFKRYLLDLAMLTVWSETEDDDWDPVFIEQLAAHFKLDQDEVDECMALVETFILHNHEDIPFLSSKNAYEKVAGNFSKRWVKILGRNKDKLTTELKESKELVMLIKKSTSGELSADEKEKVKAQFKDIIKSIPALAIFMLPGGALLLPIVLKIIPDLIPSAFRDNEVGED